MNKQTFPWKKFYSEYAEKILQYCDDRLALLPLIRTALGNHVTKVFVENVKENVDPFTCFSIFNYMGLNDSDRIDILRNVKNSFSIAADVPIDFSGLPVVRSSQMFYAHEKKESDLIWNFFQKFMSSEFKADLFDEIKNIKNVGQTKLTAPLFWIKPDEYVALDKKNIAYAKELCGENFGKKLSNVSGKDYVNICEEIKSKMKLFGIQTIAEFSSKAWLFSQEQGREADMNVLNDCKSLLEVKRNIILQGAPGTGKTYATAALALSILGVDDVDFNDHEAVMQRYNSLQISFDDDGDVNNNGQIGFVTFHQSMDYEDFVEGIKPQIANDEDKTQVQYAVFPGIFKSIVKESKFAYVDASASEAKSVETFDQKWTMLIDWANEEISKNGSCGLTTKNETTMKILEATDSMIKMQGEAAQNTTVSYRSEVKKLWDIFGTAELEKIENFNKEFRKYVGGNCTSKYAILKKMQEMSADVSESIQLDNCSSQKKDELIDLLKNDDYKKTDVKKYVLIIDEINRGNVSKIFGELISLLEADKRDGAAHPLKVTLPYSKESFSVPSNLYIIGTMNTTDRSVGSIDYAVRRRFAFVTLEADENKVPEGDARNLFKAVRNFLESSKYDMDIEDLMVGHSYFMDAANLQMKWQYEIFPLLMEYHKDGIIDKSPLKDSAGNDIAEVKKNFANFITAWDKKEPTTSNP